MVPILETPKDNPLYGEHYLIFESKLIMDFLNHKLSLNMFSENPFKKAEQLKLIDMLEKFPIYLLKIVLTRGNHRTAMQEMCAVFDTLELHFQAQPSVYLLGSDVPQMADFFAFPHISRVFYLKDGQLGEFYS